MSTTDYGRLAEVKVAAKLTELGWYPFIDMSGKCPVDLIAWKDGVVKKFQVKYTASIPKGGKSYVVQIGSVRPNRTGNVVHKYNAGAFDYLAVYVEPLDKVCFIESKQITAGRALSMTPTRLAMTTVDR